MSLREVAGDAISGLKAYREQIDANEIALGVSERTLKVIFTPTQPVTRTTRHMEMIELPHPAHTTESVCLIVRSPQRFWKEKVAAEDLPFIKRVIDISKLKQKYKSPADKANFVRSYDLFMADKSVVESVPGILGGSLIRSGKLPYIVNLAKTKPLAPVIQAKYHMTRVNLSVSSHIKVPVGYMSRDIEILTENAVSVIEQVKKLLGEIEIAQLALSYPTGPSVIIFEKEKACINDSRDDSIKLQETEANLDCPQPAASDELPTRPDSELLREGRIA